MNVIAELKKIALDLLDYKQLYESDIGHVPHPGSVEDDEDEEEMDKESLSNHVFKNQDGLRDLVPDK